MVPAQGLGGPLQEPMADSNRGVTEVSGYI